MKKYWIQIVIYTLLGLFGTVFGLAGTVVSKNLIDAVTGFNSDSIGWAFALYIGFGVSRIFYQYPHREDFPADPDEGAE